jgi:tRNA(Ile2) C34 agmatinyltransferase TiaS
MNTRIVTEAEYVASTDPAHCPLCGGALYVSGVLGSYVHYRCRDCGVDSHGEFSPIQRARIAHLRDQFSADLEEGSES